MLRTAAYRAGRPEAPSEELLAAVADLGVDLEAPFAATEAAAAWRLGERATCVALAEHAARRFTEVGVAPAALVMRALAAFVRGDPDLSALADDGAAAALPDNELQVLAFARWRSRNPPPRWRERALELAALRPREAWSVRLDVLSVDEALADGPPPVDDGRHPQLGDRALPDRD
jgi:hypothetical protein